MPLSIHCWTSVHVEHAKIVDRREQNYSPVNPDGLLLRMQQHPCKLEGSGRFARLINPHSWDNQSILHPFIHSTSSYQVEVCSQMLAFVKEQEKNIANKMEYTYGLGIMAVVDVVITFQLIKNDLR